MKTLTEKTMPGCFTAILIMLFSVGVYAFDSGSTEADGAFNPVVNTQVQLPPDGIFNFTTVNIPSGVTVTFAKNDTNTPVTIGGHAGGESVVRINQQEEGSFGRLFKSVGRYRFVRGARAWVRISNEGTKGKYLIADAVSRESHPGTSEHPGVCRDSGARPAMG